MKQFIQQHKKGSIIAGNLFLAFFITQGLGQIVKSYDGGMVISNSIFSAVCMILIYKLLILTWPLIERRLVICAGILGFVFGAMLVIGTQIYLYDCAPWTSVGFYIHILQVGLLMMMLIMQIFTRWNSWLTCIEKSWLNERAQRFTRNDRRCFFLTTLFIFVCWVPALLSAFPGIYAYDAIYQVHWFDMGTMYSHHPIAHTYLLVGCLRLGKYVLGSLEAGMLIYSLVQMSAMALIFSYLSKRVGEKLPHVVQLFFTLCFALLPYNALFSFSATKDILFAGIFAMLILKTYDIACDVDGFFHNIKKMAGYVGLVLLMCAFRNNGVYAFYCFIPVALIVCRKYWKRVLLMCLAVLLLWNCYTGPGYKLLGVEKGSIAEAMSVPVQQLARSMIENKNQISNSDQELITTYLPDWNNYEARISDAVKKRFNTTLFQKNPVEFVSLWIRVGVTCPMSYADAWASMAIGNYYPDMIYRDPGAWHPYIEYLNSDPVTADVLPEEKEEYTFVNRTTLLKSVASFYDTFAYHTPQQSMPGVSMLFSPGAAVWLMLFGMMYCIYRKRYLMALPFSILVGLWLTLLLGPVVLLRYVYPIMVCAPIIIVMMCKDGEDKEKKQ